MARGNRKPVGWNSAAVLPLVTMSKNALVDLALDLLTGMFGVTESVDDENGFCRFVATHARRVLKRRGDRGIGHVERGA